jgi:hypothetical protein
MSEALSTERPRDAGSSPPRAVEAPHAMTIAGFLCGDVARLLARNTRGRIDGRS